MKTPTVVVVPPKKDEDRIVPVIELDCGPGSPRPGDLLPEVLEGTGLPVREPVSTFFGNWTWVYKDM